jgi:hypothetical protein
MTSAIRVAEHRDVAAIVTSFVGQMGLLPVTWVRATQLTSNNTSALYSALIGGCRGIAIGW